MTEAQAFLVLQLMPDADWSTIKAAYRVRALRWHPDAGGDAEQFQRICAAYNVLRETEPERYRKRHLCPVCQGDKVLNVRRGWRIVGTVQCPRCAGLGSI